MASDRTIPETGVMDRYSGREADEFSVDNNLTFEDRLSRFEGAEIELMRAEAYMERGADKAEAYGDIKDVREAIDILRGSAEYHANGFSKEELSKAAEEKTVDVAVLQAIADRRTIDQRPRIPEGLADRLRDEDQTRTQEPNRETDRDQER
jgi:hypothetical protein